MEYGMLEASLDAVHSVGCTNSGELPLLTMNASTNCVQDVFFPSASSRFPPGTRKRGRPKGNPDSGKGLFSCQQHRASLSCRDLAPTLFLPEGTRLTHSKNAEGEDRWSILEPPEWVKDHFSDPVLCGKMQDALLKRAFYATQQVRVLHVPYPVRGSYEPVDKDVRTGLFLDANDGAGIFFLCEEQELKKYLHPTPRTVLGWIDK